MSRNDKKKKTVASKKYFYIFRLVDVQGIARPQLNSNQHQPDIESFIKKVNPHLRHNGERAFYVPDLP